MPVAPSLTGTRDSVLIPSGSPSCLKQCDCAELATPSAQRDAVTGHSAHSSLLTASLCPWLRGPRRVTAGDRALPPRKQLFRSSVLTVYFKNPIPIASWGCW